MRHTATRLAKALDAKREAWMQLEILEGLGRDPSVGRDIAFDAYSDARDRYAAIIKEEWELRAMSRGYVPAKFDATLEGMAAAVEAA